MKRILSLCLATLMVLTAMTAISLPVMATDGAVKDLPSGQIWEGESDLVFSDFVNSGKGKVIGHGNDFEHSGKMSQNGFLLWDPGSVGEYLEFSLQVETEGEKTLMFQYLAAQDLGIFDIYFDGTLLRENLDMYVPTSERGMVELDLGKMEITQGVHKLKVVYKGQNSGSSKDQLTIDYIELVGKDGTRRFVNKKTAKDDYKNITRFEDGTIRYEIETMERAIATQANKTYDLATQIYKGYGTDIPWGYAAHLLWKNADIGDKASFRFFVERAGEYELNFHSALAEDRGIVEIQIDSAPVLTANQYNDGQKGAQYSPEETIMLKAGYHTLTLVHKGKSEDADKNNISLDFMEIKRVGGFARTGQIWEGETELLGYGGTGIKYNINGTDYVSTGKIDSNLKHINTEAKPGYNAAVLPSRELHMRFQPNAANAWIEFTLDVKTAGKKDVYFQYWAGANWGKYKVTWRLEGVAPEDATVLAEEIDFYNSAWEYKEMKFDQQVEVAPGKYVLRFENTGRNQNCTHGSYGMSIDYFELVGEDGVRRTQKRDMGGSDYDKVYYADDGTVRHIIWNMPTDEKTQENLANKVYTIQLKKGQIEDNSGISCGGFGVGARKLILAGLEKYVGTQEKPEYTVNFYVDKNGYYSVSAGMTNYKESSLVSFKINGDPVGKVVDQCSPSFNSASYVNLTPSLYLEEGWNTFTIVFEGKSPKNTTNKTRIDFDFFEIYEISSGEPFEIDPNCTPYTGDATIYVVIALCVSAMALAIPAVAWTKKKKASK